MSIDYETLGNINKLYAYVLNSIENSKRILETSIEFNYQATATEMFGKIEAYTDIKQYMEQLFNYTL